MKKITKIMLVSVALAAALAISAFAADFTHCADAMNEIGVFKGTQNGYELDRAANRAEAAAMLVRLLGAEEEALSLSYSAPFDDVADWAKPYVQYLYDNGLTNGKTATKFGYSDACTAQQYATFILRALGYSDGANGDFTYVNAIDFAKQVGVCDYANCNENNFLRDDVAAMSFTALATAPKSGEADLLTKLVSSGAIADDKGYIEMFKNYRIYAEASGKYNAETKISGDINIEEAYSLEVGNVKDNYALKFAIDFNEEDINKSEMSFIGTGKSELELPEYLQGVEGLQNSEAVEIKNYYTDGYAYSATGDEKYKEPMDFRSFFNEIGADFSASVEPICLITGITVKKNAREATETYETENAPSVLNRVLRLVYNDNVGEYKSARNQVVIKNGKLFTISSEVVIETEADGVPVLKESSMKMSNIKTGTSVRVLLPSDLDKYILAY